MNRKCAYLFVSVFLFIVGILSIHTCWTLSHAFTPDFSVYYQAAKNMLASIPLYNGKQLFTLFAYPPVSALIFLPFTLFPYQISQTIFLLMSFSALVGVSYLIPFSILRKRSVFLSAIIFSFSYLSFPTKFTFGMGQVNLLAYFFLLVSFVLLPRSELGTYGKRYTFLVSLFLAIGCVLKPILGFTLLLFLFQKQWRILIYVGILFAIFFGISYLVDQRALLDWLYYGQHVIPEVGKLVGREVYYNQGWVGFVFRVIPDMTWRVWLGYGGMVGIVGMLVVMLAKHKNLLYQFSIILSALLLLDTMSWQHHFVFLIFPYVYMFWVCATSKRWKLFGITCLSYLLVSSNIVYPGMFMHVPWNFLLSNTFYGAFLLYVLLIITPPGRSQAVH